jgi:hypothetical protein
MIAGFHREVAETEKKDHRLNVKCVRLGYYAVE